MRAVFEEFGFELEVDGYEADVVDPAAHYAPPANGFAVAEDGHGRVVGCVGFTGEGHGTFELHRLYVLREARRHGLGEALVRWVIGQARERGGTRIILFSDIQFTDAHRLYERLGFRRTRFRYAPDPWQSREWGYELSLAGGGA
ncbi:MAG: hypothetical protein Kow0010_14440 [Dehalococcoidia bacterium]